MIMCGALDIAGAAAGGYLVGSIPIGYIVVKVARGMDVRSVGSGAMGATNVSRVLGKGAGAAVSVADMLKGVAAFALGKTLLGDVAFGAQIAATAAVIGHCFPVWIGFRGGKGVSTAFGAAVALATVPALLALASFATTLAAAKRVSAASITAVWTFAGFTFWIKYPTTTEIMAAFLAAFITFTHRENLARLVKGKEEPIFGRRLYGNGDAEKACG